MYPDYLVSFMGNGIGASILINFFQKLNKSLLESKIETISENSIRSKEN